MARFFSILALLVILAASAYLGYHLLAPGHDWGDDFACYIEQARSITQGHPRAFLETNRFTVENSPAGMGPVAYPWGFPLLLAPLYAITGLNLTAFKILCLACFLLFLVWLYALAAPHMGRLAALLLVAVMAVNPVLLQFADNILSEFPFLLFCFLSLYLLDRFIVRRAYLLAPARPPAPGGLPAAPLPLFPVILSHSLLGAAVFYAAFTRSNGMLLLPVLLLAQVLEGLWPQAPRLKITRRGFLLALVPWAALLLLAGVAQILMPDGSHSHLGLFDDLSWTRLEHHALYYLKLPLEFFAAGQPFLATLLYGATIPLFFRGLFRRLRSEYSLSVFLVLNLVLYILWPPIQGLRFLYPILPIYMYLVFHGLLPTIRTPSPAASPAAGVPAPRRISAPGTWGDRAFLVLAAGVLIVLFYQGTSLALRNNQHPRPRVNPFDDATTEMTAYIRDHTAPQAVCIFFKPRILRLLTSRRAFASDRPADFLKGDYLILHRRMNRNYQVGPVPPWDSPCVTTLVFENAEYNVYHLTAKPPG